MISIRSSKLTDRQTDNQKTRGTQREKDMQFMRLCSARVFVCYDAKCVCKTKSIYANKKMYNNIVTVKLYISPNWFYQ